MSLKCVLLHMRAELVYQFPCSCGNGSILLEYLKRVNASDPVSCTPDISCGQEPWVTFHICYITKKKGISKIMWTDEIMTASMASPISIQFEAFQAPMTTSWLVPLALTGSFPPKSHSVYLPALLAVPWVCPGMQAHSNDLLAECRWQTVIIIFESSGNHFKS